jgi:hypothetical protein
VLRDCAIEVPLHKALHEAAEQLAAQQQQQVWQQQVMSEGT